MRQPPPLLSARAYALIGGSASAAPAMRCARRAQPQSRCSCCCLIFERPPRCARARAGARYADDISYYFSAAIFDFSLMFHGFLRFAAADFAVFAIAIVFRFFAMIRCRRLRCRHFQLLIFAIFDAVTLFAAAA
jgi:hypothetical protein